MPTVILFLTEIDTYPAHKSQNANNYWHLNIYEQAKFI